MADYRLGLSLESIEKILSTCASHFARQEQGDLKEIGQTVRKLIYRRTSGGFD